MKEAKIFSFMTNVAIVGAIGLTCIKLYKVIFGYINSNINDTPKKICKILFFPDEKVACRNHLTLRHGCTSPACKFSHDSHLSYAQLITTLNNARVSVDLCVFCLTASELCTILCELSDRGIVVRVITDSEQLTATGSQVGILRREGIQVRHDETSFYMHHKFAVIDRKLLLNGSFNWTRSAITGNHENLCITNYKEIVQPFIDEFERLWDKFDKPSSLTE